MIALGNPRARGLILQMSLLGLPLYGSNHAIAVFRERDLERPHAAQDIHHLSGVPVFVLGPEDQIFHAL